MKYLFLLALITTQTFAVCSLPITRTSNGANSVLTSTKYNADVNTAYNRVNNLPGDCVTDASITTSKIAANTISTSKIADGAVTTAKLASGALPVAGRLLRIGAFTSSGTWTKQSDVGSIMVQVVGGGGSAYSGSANNGGSSSFGSHCIAGGGSKPSSGGANSPGGLGGTASNGDINLTGGNGSQSNSNGYHGHSGVSVLGSFGLGGRADNSVLGSGGGGAGAYCSKLIQVANLSATETVTIGAGGSNGVSGDTPGTSGIVLVYEYSK